MTGKFFEYAKLPAPKAGKRMSPDEVKKHIDRIKEHLTPVIEECKALIETGGLDLYDVQMLTSFYAIAEDFMTEL